jgi:hypothetical protein
MEVGLYLDRPSLTVCTTQLCRSGVGFVSCPYTDSAKVTTIQLHHLVELCRTTSQPPMAGQEQANSLATEAIKRIDLCLARRTSAEKVVLVAKLMYLGWPWARVAKDKDFYSDIHRHYSLSSNRQLENGRSLALECHVRADSFTAVALFLLEGTTSSCFNGVSTLASCPYLLVLDLSWADEDNVSALASCHALHTLDLSGSAVSDVSALASCQALQTLDLTCVRVSDVSALASCQALHTLQLSSTLVRDVSALASCQALHTLGLHGTRVKDVSALASFPALHSLNLTNTKVSDVSVLASCPALHSLNLFFTQVIDISALAACGSLRYVDGCQRMLGYGAIARLLENRRC